MKANYNETIQSYEQRLVCIHDLVESKDLSIVDSHASEMERLKLKLTEFVKLSEVWEDDRQAKNTKIDELEEKLIAFEAWQEEKVIYEEKQKLLEDEIEAERQIARDRYFVKVFFS